MTDVAGVPGLFAQLPPDRQAAVLAYDGPQDHGDPAFLQAVPQPPKMRAFKFRGPNSFHFARRHYPLASLRDMMAEHRTCYPGGGGNWSGRTGDGEAWANVPDRTWGKVRTIRRGQWSGPWRRVRLDEI